MRGPQRKTLLSLRVSVRSKSSPQSLAGGNLTPPPALQGLCSCPQTSGTSLAPNRASVHLPPFYTAVPFPPGGGDSQAHFTKGD